MKPLTVRSRWLERRVERGRLRPLPLRVRVVNVASVSYPAPRARGVFTTALTRRGQQGTPDVLAACELADVTARKLAGPTWTFIQHGLADSPDSALGLGVHISRGRVLEDQLLAGTPATDEGRGIRKRPILRARLGIDVATPRAWAPTFLVSHAPPGRAPKARAAYLRRLRPWSSDIVLGDLNIGHRAALRLLGRRIHSAGVLHVAVPLWIPSTSSSVDVGSDHLAIDVTLWPASTTREPRT